MISKQTRKLLILLSLLMMLLASFSTSVYPVYSAKAAAARSPLNPTLQDPASFAKTVTPHEQERALRMNRGPAAIDWDGATGGRWGATGEEQTILQAASANQTRPGWSWVGWLGLFGLAGLSRYKSSKKAD